jgi:gamma-glutamyltranspeptidase
MLRFAHAEGLPVQAVVSAGKEGVLAEKLGTARWGRTVVVAYGPPIAPGAHADFRSFATAFTASFNAAWARAHAPGAAQQAVEAPRFRSDDGVRGIIEDRFPGEVRAGLAARGHDFRAVAGWTAPFGNLMIVQRTSSGVLRTGADMRREGAAIAW